MDSIGQRLRFFIDSKFSSLKDFCDIIEMNPGNVQKYLTGKRKPGTPILQRLQAQGMNIDWLLTGEGEMYEKKQQHERLQTPVKQALTGILSEDAARYTFPPDNITKAIGKSMCVHGIHEGDLLVLAKNKKARPGDLVININEGYPKITRHQPGDQQPHAIIERLIRNCRPPEN